MENERIFTHNQRYPFRFQSSSLAPAKGGSGKARFSVEPMIYIEGAGWDIVDFHVKGNEFALGFWKYVRSKELMGLEHTGDTADQIKATIEKLWGKRLTSEMQVRFISAIDREYTELMKEGPQNIDEVRELHEMQSKIKELILEL